MQAFQQRVVDEKRDLDKKLQALTGFFSTNIYLSLPGDEQARLSRQANHMRDYSLVLGERIANFKEE